jgi:hypothetical protein
MTPKYKLDVAIFIFIAVFCALDFWRVRDSSGAAARSVRFRAGGILVWASMLLFGSVVPYDAFGPGSSTVMMSLVLLGGLALVYMSTRQV